MASIRFGGVERPVGLVVIGGSAGSFPIVSRLLEAVSPSFPVAIVMCLHRLKDKREGFREALEIKSAIPVAEPEDKGEIRPGMAYVAPANYHLLIEAPGHFSLAITELVQYSRPSIDVLFESAADVFESSLLGILLSGANRDGALGMRRIGARGGLTFVQDPAESSMPTMPDAAIQMARIDAVLPVAGIIEKLRQIR
jgi:two-component system, chemotaxis family, protein-glutamate methylesterase/glutaminase